MEKAPDTSGKESPVHCCPAVTCLGSRAGLIGYICVGKRVVGSENCIAANEGNDCEPAGIWRSLQRGARSFCGFRGASPVEPGRPDWTFEAWPEALELTAAPAAANGLPLYTCGTVRELDDAASVGVPRFPFAGNPRRLAIPAAFG